LRRLLLPDEVNLKRPELGDWYGTATVEISGKSPGSVITRKGAPMVYGVTIPRRAPNRQAAMAFVSFLLSADEGMAILARNGQPPLVPVPSESFARIPPPLKRFALEPK
jgi:molybdate/tungstate transport system substrate-binding protein